MYLTAEFPYNLNDLIIIVPQVLMKIFTLILALAWALTIFVTIYFQMNFLGLDSNSWGLIFSAIFAICASILYFYESKKSKSSYIKQKASAKEKSSVIQVGRDYTSGKK